MVNNEAYDHVVEDGLTVFQDLVAAYFAGVITLLMLRSQFTEALKIYFVNLMILGLDGREPSAADIDFVNGKITEHLALLDVFLADLAIGAISEKRALWRAGLYATDREAYIFYTVPNSIASLMPGLPGEVCLGNGLCHCELDVQYDDEGNASVYWIVNPESESCSVCLDMESQSPFLFSREELASNG